VRTRVGGEDLEGDVVGPPAGEGSLSRLQEGATEAAAPRVGADVHRIDHPEGDVALEPIELLMRHGEADDRSITVGDDDQPRGGRHADAVCDHLTVRFREQM
jgi:hypothetical protein